MASALDRNSRLSRQGPARVRAAATVRGALVVVVVLSFGGLISACTLDETGPPATQVANWMSTSGSGADIGQVEADSDNVTYVLAHHETPSQIKTACALLTTDAQTGIGNLPTPDTELTDDLNNAYEDAAAAGTDCYHGASGGSLLVRSAQERGKLGPLIATAVDRIEAITGRTPSTSTTISTQSNNDPFAN
jgi:hypothetical protein